MIPKKISPKAIDLFAGCGGLSLGFQQAGFEIVGFIEQWKPAIKTHLKNFPESKHIGLDITQVTEQDLEEYKEKIDVIIGGPPCQGFSICGKRNPFDKRNTLYKEFLRIVEIIKPKYIVMENVKGILSMKTPEGQPVINTLLNDFIKLGYLICYKTLRAVDYGVAQKRERVIVIGKKCNYYPRPTTPTPINTIEAIQDIPEKISGQLYSQNKPETIERIKQLKQGERLCKTFNFSRQRIYADKPSPTIATKQRLIHPYKHRFLTPREIARLQSFPDTFEFCGTLSNMIKQIGNAVPPKLAEAVAKNIFTEVK